MIKVEEIKADVSCYTLSCNHGDEAFATVTRRTSLRRSECFRNTSLPAVCLPSQERQLAAQCDTRSQHHESHVAHNCVVCAALVVQPHRFPETRIDVI